MTTIDELIDALCATPRGQVFLINLYRTLQYNYVTASQLKICCEEFLSVLSTGGGPIPFGAILTDRLGETFVGKGLWRHGPKPILENHLPMHEFVLSRVTSYSGFFYSVLKRRRGMPSLPDMPEPNDLTLGHRDEINMANVSAVRQSINRGKWKSLIIDDVRLNAHCVWLAPLPRLRMKIGSCVINQADVHRDIIGLSHLTKGHHLVRLDINLHHWSDWPTTYRRRPHGVGNGGSRFRLQYDGKECKCQWGRTVDLSRVAAGCAKSLNGIPELLMEGFSVPKAAVKATYLGPIIHPPENNDAHFIKRLKKNQALTYIVAELKRNLA